MLILCERLVFQENTCTIRGTHRLPHAPVIEIRASGPKIGRVYADVRARTTQLLYTSTQKRAHHVCIHDSNA